MKICKCKFEIDKEEYKFCPLCGNNLMELELEEDGTYKAVRKACKIIDSEFADPTQIYYYKISPIDDEMAWIYNTKYAKHFIMGCHISKIKTIDEERMEKCIFRENDECGNSATCRMCSVFKKG